MVKIATSLIISGCLLAATAAAPSIGIVRSTGQFSVDGSPVQGNSTLFAGNTIETSNAQSRIRLDNLDLALYPQSRARIYGDHAALEKGSATVTGSVNYAIDADKLRITSKSDDAVWQVAVVGPNLINVAAQKGGAEVRNSNGVLLAVVQPGIPLAFAPQAGGANPPNQPSSSGGGGGAYSTGAKVVLGLTGVGIGTMVGLTASGHFDNTGSVSTH